MNKQTILTGILIIILIVLGALWYYYVLQRPSEDAASEASIDADAYQRIKDLKLDVALFADPVFRELKQETIPPPLTESVGRSNPFLPF